MSVAFMRIYLGTHEGYRILKTVKEEMQISIEKGAQNPVIPIPYYVSGPGLNGLGSNVARNSELGQMHIINPVSRKDLTQSSFAEFRSIHAHRVAANVDQRVYRMGP